ncbi:Uncharacterised protein [Helicobacter fennelliae]|nr:Uncharacterised protein [Helicobacter fennelliae]
MKKQNTNHTISQIFLIMAFILPQNVYPQAFHQALHNESLQATHHNQQNLDSESLQMPAKQAKQNLDSMPFFVIARREAIQNPESRIQNPESRIQNPESRIQNPESRIQNPESKTQNLDSTQNLATQEPTLTTLATQPQTQSNTTQPQPQPYLQPRLPQSAESPLYLRYNLGFDFFLDNTEGSDPYWATRTLYAIRIAPEIGMGIGQNHSIMFGGFAIQNMGASTIPTKANISAYYRYEGEIFRAYFGIFGRRYWRGEYPLSFFRQDFLFFNPNTNGVLLQYISHQDSAINGYAEFVFDWFGGNLAKRFDEFFVLASGKVRFLNNYGFVGGSALLYHFKNDEVLSQDGAFTPSGLPDTQLMDKIYYNAYIGVDFVPLLRAMQTAQIQFGALSSIERKRRLSGLGAFHHAMGYEGGFKLQYKGFGLEESYYFGDGQMYYYSEYGENFYDGLPFYRADRFNRVNVFYEYRNNWLKANLSFMFFSLPQTFALQQMLTLSIDTHRLFGK